MPGNCWASIWLFIQHDLLLLKQVLELFAVQLFAFHQLVSEFRELVTMLFQDCTSHLIALLKNLLHLEINQSSHACTAGIIASRRHISIHPECGLGIG